MEHLSTGGGSGYGDHTPYPRHKFGWRCVCVTGRRLCPEAVQLWKELVLLAQPGMIPERQSAYEAACLAFDRHYRRQEEPSRPRRIVRVVRS